MRGEYCEREFRHIHDLELPPRARRIRRAGSCAGGRVGTTSACAENTANRVSSNGIGGNYLRVRGEYREPGLIERHRWELPPRARRILAVPAQRHRTVGTTSACAENTKVKAWLGAFFRNYLRVRGEYGANLSQYTDAMELPPRARRIRWSERQKGNHHGTTSACAENTRPTRLF